MTAHNIFTTLPTPGSGTPGPLSARVDIDTLKSRSDLKEGGENENQSANKNDDDEGEYLEVHHQGHGNRAMGFGANHRPRPHSPHGLRGL